MPVVTTLATVGSAAGKAGKAARDSGGGSVSSGDVGGYISDTKGRRRRERALDEYQDQLRNEAVFNYGRDQRSTEAVQDYMGEHGGNLTTDFVTGDMLAPTSRDQIGGAALENMVGMASGYNPTMAYNPYLSITAADRAGVEGLRNQAAYDTERTLGGWEEAMAGLQDSYDTAAGKLGDARDAAREDYRSSLDEKREADRQAEAQHIIQQWIDSEYDGDGFKETGAFGMRSKGADNDEKALKLAQAQYKYGDDWAAIMRELGGYLERTPDTAGLYRNWVDNG